jgi:hypothetical protein
MIIAMVKSRYELFKSNEQAGYGTAALVLTALASASFGAVLTRPFSPFTPLRVVVAVTAAAAAAHSVKSLVKKGNTPCP